MRCAKFHAETIVNDEFSQKTRIKNLRANSAQVSDILKNSTLQKSSDFENAESVRVQLVATRTNLKPSFRRKLESEIRTPI